MERKRTSRLRIAPDNIENLNQDEIFVFGSNLEGHHAGGAANYAFKKFGAIWGEGDGLTGQSYAIPTMHGGIDAIKPYIDKFISYAKTNKGKKFLVTRVGCGIAGFYDNQMAPLFKEAIKLDNVFLPRRWVEILLADKKIQEFLGEALDDCDFYRLHAVREDDLIKLSEKYRPQILKGDKSNLPKIKVRYITPDEKFGFTDFGDCFMLRNKELYVFTDNVEFTNVFNRDMLDCYFRGECERKESVRKVYFAGVETRYRDSCGDKIYSGDVLKVRYECLALGTFGSNSDEYGMNARYAFVLDNHCLFPEDCERMTRVGTAFYDVDKHKQVDVSAYCQRFQGGFPGDAVSREEKLIMAKHTPKFNREETMTEVSDINDESNENKQNNNTSTMQKIGRIKSWYIDPDDPNGNRVMYTIHNYLMVKIVDGEKFYAALSDTSTNEDWAVALEMGEFELNGMKFNARFDDAKGNTQYTNVSKS